MVTLLQWDCLGLGLTEVPPSWFATRFGRPRIVLLSIGLKAIQWDTIVCTNDKGVDLTPVLRDVTKVT